MRVSVLCLIACLVAPAGAMAADEGQEAFRKAQQFLSGAEATYDPAKAAALFAESAADGHSGAQFYLGMLASRGLGVDLDKARAVGLFRAAAHQGHALAQLKLAEAYFSGDGTAQDSEMARGYFLPLAADGDGRAQLYLGLMAETGMGAPADPVAAYRWYAQAAQAPWPAIADQAALFRGALSRRMSAGQLARARRP